MASGKYKASLTFWGKDAEKYAETLKEKGYAPVQTEAGVYALLLMTNGAKPHLDYLRGGLCVATTWNTGPLSHLRTVVEMNIKVGGKVYPYSYDFGYGYSADAAEYMWKDGNYACDCNKRLFLSKVYPEIECPEDPPCGDEIEIIDFEIKFKEENE